MDVLAMIASARISAPHVSQIHALVRPVRVALMDALVMIVSAQVSVPHVRRPVPEALAVAEVKAVSVIIVNPMI